MSKKVFNEETLGEAILKKWGKSGYYEVFQALQQENKELYEILKAAAYVKEECVGL